MTSAQARAFIQDRFGVAAGGDGNALTVAVPPEQWLALGRAARESLGDARLGLAGVDRRPLGRVDDARPLTVYDPAHPYFEAEYDLPDRG